ncbi:MAG: c-type cytochrome [Planctomycetaceae bacterium]|nr:c-type cytochrome [Planctomycetaceae bacterium]
MTSSTLHSYAFRSFFGCLVLLLTPTVSRLLSAAESDVWSEQMPAVADSQVVGEAPATDSKPFVLQPGFQVELLYSVPKDKQGSWVSLTKDGQGRLLASDQGDKGIYRIIPSPIGSDQPTRVEKLDVAMTSAQGMLHAFDSLYFSINGGPGSGLYRAKDTNNDDQFDEVVKLKQFKGGGEHGPHAIRLSPDGKSLYVICGNHTDPPTDFDASRVLSNWGEDLLLPRQWDANGHARNKLAPGGWIAKTDPDGKNWEIVSIGYRNAYDFDFNPEGELFAYDADMEWDLGTPWYRPTRAMHAVSGSDFGWRSGTGKWPSYFVDSLPAAVDIGPGSPVGVTFGTGAKFPANYQRALYLLDWTFGTMYAVHLKPEGASYVGQKEEFVSRVALPLTDAVIGDDGAMYFTVGGRGTQSALYRVTYQGDEKKGLTSGQDQVGADLRKLRRQLEQYHHSNSVKPTDAATMDLIWKNLSHSDRHIRYAACVALEHQSLDQWRDRVGNMADANGRIQSVVALARAGSRAWAGSAEELALARADALAVLNQIDFEKLTEAERLDLLRAYALVFIRLGKPDVKQSAVLVEKINPYFPGESHDVNIELARILIYLNAPAVVQKSLKLMDEPYALQAEQMKKLLARNPGYGGTIAKMMANHPELQKLQYVFMLRNMRYGWTLEERKQYFDWLERAKKKSGGASYGGFIENIRKEAMANLSEDERAALVAKSPPKPIPAEELPKAQGPGQSWTISDVVIAATPQGERPTTTGLRKRDFENGRKMFAAAKCMTCHRFDGRGGATGPDLTSVNGRFSVRDLAEAMVDPSKVISDQYRASVIETSQGKVISGRVVAEDDDELTVQTNAEDASQVEVVRKGDIEEQTPSPTSLMPDKLLDTLNQEEVLDLIAYLLSRGNPNDLMFQ